MNSADRQPEEPEGLWSSGAGQGRKKIVCSANGHACLAREAQVLAGSMTPGVTQGCAVPMRGVGRGMITATGGGVVKRQYGGGSAVRNGRGRDGDSDGIFFAGGLLSD